MPTSWKKSPAELHRIYLENTEAFYSAAGRGLSGELDEFMRQCAFGLWSHSAAVTQDHADAVNQLYSRNQKSSNFLLWELTGKVCSAGEVLPPLFFWNLTEDDARRGRDTSRIFVRMTTNILLYLAAVDDELTYDEARFITDCGDRLSALCDSAGVKKSKPALRATDYVTSGESSFIDKNVQQYPSGAPAKGKESTAEGTNQTEKPDLDTLMAQLDELVGLEEVKKEVRSLINLIKVRKLRKENDLPVPPMSLHLVFLGNPGTGKTTVARLLAGLYAAIGVLEKGQLVEVDRSGLVAGYVGQTALKTQEVINSALGGVLFIDEAYSLASGGENDYGREAIETLLKAMEDHRDELVVIAAGYDEPMEMFISSNPGLESRFNKYFYFPDYNGDELFRIMQSQCSKNGYVLEGEAAEAAKAMLTQMYENRDENFGNGRDVRNRFEDMVSRHSDRVAAMDSPDRDDLMKFMPEDICETGDSSEN